MTSRYVNLPAKVITINIISSPPSALDERAMKAKVFKMLKYFKVLNTLEKVI